MRESPHAVDREADWAARLMDTARVLVLVLDAGGCIVHINPFMLRLSGYDISEVVGKDYFDTFVPERMRSHVRQSFKMPDLNAPGARISPIITEDGRVRDIEWYGTPLSEDAGTIAGVLAIGHDVTKHQQVNEALRESRERYQTLFDHSINGVALHEIVTDTEGRPIDSIFLEVNHAFEELTGLRAPEIIGRRVTTVLPGMERDPFIEVYGHVALTREDIRFEYFFTPLKRHYEIVAFSPRRGQFAAIFTDISERKRMEEALRHNEALFRSLAENSLDCIAILDVDGTIRYANPSHEQEFGFKPEELLGKNAFAFIHPDDLHQLAETFGHGTRVANTTASAEYRFQHKDGSWRIMEGNARNLLSDPAVAGVLVNSRDVTDRRQAEEEIRRLNLDLEQRVAKRTEQIEAANRELESFSFSVSHDLRTPLRAIDGFTQILMADHSDKLGEEATSYLQRVRGATQRMGQLIDALLALSRVMRAEMHREQIDLSALAREIAADLRQAHLQRRVTLVIADGMVAHADEYLLRAALENLLGNAWKYTSKNEDALIELGVTEQDGTAVYFVRDDGVGFDMEYADKMFGAFQRLHTLDDFEGSGVGLATVRRIIHRHGGQVWAEGALDRGATFFFTLAPDARGE